MNIKTFQGNSFQEGLDKVYAEFGEQAKILHSREVIESRWFGLLKKKYVEITAAEPDKFEKEFENKIKNKFANDTKNSVENETENESLSESQSTHKSNQIFDRQPIGNKLNTNRSDYDFDLGNCNCSDGSFFETNNRGQKTTTFPPKDQRLRSDVISGLGGGVFLGGWRRMELCDMNPTLLQRNLLMMFDEFVCFGGAIDFSSGSRVVALVGSTGVGKTSTIAKLAAHYKLRESCRVGLLTTDVFRIAAADQLRRYADMLDVPFETVSDADRVQAALKRLGVCDLVLIDTPGMNPLNVLKLRGTDSILRNAGVDEVHLLLSATSSLPVFSEAINRFSILSPTGLTLTKLDEAVGISELYKMLKLNNLPLKFFTFGQNISEDIEVAGAARLVSLYQHNNLF
ncbi:MAG: hypothetical protein LBT09_11960 [Planctomycetaceae bacterium]|jgi:flagellar biosynthesis protein FlhF|nr:hypothetical protein [Planctomycetaceae bacterium]